MEAPMEEKTLEKHDEIEIDLSRLISALVDKALLIAIVSVICAVATFLGTYFLVTPLYQSRAKFYVNNSSLSSLSDAALSRIPWSGQDLYRYSQHP